MSKNRLDLQDEGHFQVQRYLLGLLLLLLDNDIGHALLGGFGFRRLGFSTVLTQPGLLPQLVDFIVKKCDKHFDTHKRHCCGHLEPAL